MADTKISALTALTGAGSASGDKIPIDDVSATTTKSITVAELLIALGAAGASTTAPFGVGSVELGHASDTTIARVSAGLISVEGSNVLMASNIASDAEVYAATAGNKPLKAAHLTSSNAFVALTSSAASIALDWATGINFSHTATENTTLANATNGIPGTWRRFQWTNHASSPKTLAFGNQYKFVGGAAPTITATNSAVDVLMIFCRTSSIFEVYASLALA